MTTILIVDDEALLVKMYQIALEAAGYRVYTAKDGQEGWDKIKELKPNLVLLDIMMPEMTGFDILDKISKDPELSWVKVVMLTNLTWEPDPNEALRRGALDVWVKSQHKPKDVVSKVKKFFA